MTDTNTDDRNALDEFDLTFGMQFDVTPSEIHALADGLTEAEAYDTANASDERLAEYTTALKHLADAAEDARKDVFEDALSERVEPGDEIGDLRMQEGRNTWIADPEAAFAAVSDAGEDPMRVASVSISDLRDVLGERADEFIESASYTYFRRQA